MSIPHSRHLSVAIALFGLASCTSEIAITGDVVLECANDAECPEGFRCVPTTGRCLSRDITDVEAPGLDPNFPVSLEPEIGTVGTEMLLTLRVTERLDRVPVVSFVDRAEVRPLEALSPSTAAGEDLRFRYIPTGEETETRHGLQIELVDELGNRAALPLGVALTLDFEAPTVLPGSDSVELLAAQDNLRDEVSAVRRGTSVLIRFAVSELLAEGPEVFIPNQDLVLTAENVGGVVYQVEWAFDGELADGEYPFSVRLRDAAGNESETAFSGSSITVDSIAPAPPLLVGDDGLVITRAPWGTPASEAPIFRVSSGPGAVEPGSRLVVFRGEAFEPADVVARIAPDGEGAIPASNIPLADREVVWVTLVDAAGNASDAVSESPEVDGFDIKRVRWIAALNGKQTGRLLGNPNALIASPSPRRGPWSAVDVEYFPAQDVALDDGATATTVAQHRVNVPGTNQPPAFSRASLSYDRIRSETLLAAGGQTWIWDGTRWDERNPTRFVDGRASFDPTVGALVSFSDDQFWTWTGTDWIEIGTATTPPAGVLVYDPFNDGTLMVTESGTWLFEAADWRRLAVTPSFRFDGKAWASDRVNRSVVGFGSALYLADFQLRRDRDTRRWTGAEWIDGCVDPCTPAPGMDFGWTGAERPEGGIYIVNATSDTVWAYDGEDWMSVYVGPLDPGRGLKSEVGTAAFDVARDELLVFTADTPATSTRLYSRSSTDTDWVPRGREALPAAIAGGAAAVDPSDGSIFVVGGSAPAATWRFDGARFEALGNAPFSVPTWGLNLVDMDGVLTLFRGEGTGLYQWNGNAWEARCDGVPSTDDCTTPSVRTGTRAVYDAARGEMLIFGGSEPSPPRFDSNTRVFDGSQWRSACQAPECEEPPARSRTALAYDAAREVVVMFGGCNDYLTNSGIAINRLTACSSVLADTWEWDGTTWTEKCTGASPDDADYCPVIPPASQMHHMDFLDSAEVVMMTGGQDVAGVNGRGARWTWDGVQWRTVPTETSAPPSVLAATVYDAGRNRHWVFGGFTGPTSPFAANPIPGGTTSLHYVGFGGRVEQRFRVAVAESGFDASDTAQALRVRWVGAATSADPSCSPTFAVRPWLGDSWADASSGSDGESMWSTEQPDVLARSLRSGADRLIIAGFSEAPGCVDNAVSTDSVSVEIEFTRN